MNCDYCGSEVQKSEATMTDMGDMVCTPCLVGKPIEVVKPAIGMSVSMGIGSDSYHEIIVKMERNAKTIYTMPARVVLGGVALSDWNEVPESIKAKRAADAMQDQVEMFKQELPMISEGRAMEQATRCYTFRNTGRRAGKYVAKGSTCCTLILDDQYEYRDPSF